MNITLTNPAVLMAALAGTAPVTLSVDGVTDLTVTVIEPEPPPAPDLDLPADVLLGWYRCRAEDLTVDEAGNVAEWRDSSTHARHLTQATGSRPHLGQHAATADLAVLGDEAGAYLESGATISGAQTALCALSLVGPDTVRTTPSAPLPFADSYRSILATDAMPHPSSALLVGRVGSGAWMDDTGLDGTYVRDGVTTTDAGPLRVRAVHEAHLTDAALAGHLLLGKYPTYGFHPPGATHEVVILSGLATEAHKATARAYLHDRHLTAPVVVCAGDSQVAGVGLGDRRSWPSRLWSRYGGTVSVRNEGVPGQRASGLTVPTVAMRGQAEVAVAVLASGVNDLHDGVSAADVLASLLAKAAEAEANGYTVVLCTLAANVGYADVAALNALIVSTWTGPLVRIDQIALSLLPDDLHYSEAMANAVADAVGAAVDALL